MSLIKLSVSHVGLAVLLTAAFAASVPPLANSAFPDTGKCVPPCTKAQGCATGCYVCVHHKDSCCCPAAPTPAPQPPPSDWAQRIESNLMLYTPDDRHPAGFKPSSGWGRHAPISNGVVGTIVDSGIVYLSGTFNGPDVSTTKAYAANFSNPGARPHLAKVPSNLAIYIAQGTVFACALDLERGMYLRRSKLPATGAGSAVVEQRWYAHRTRKNLLVMEVELLGSNSESQSGATAQTVGLELFDVGNFSKTIDVDWVHVEEGPSASTTSPWSRSGNTKQNEDGSTPGSITLAYVSTPVPASVDLSVGEVAYFFGVAESTITDASAKPIGPKSTPLQRAQATYAALEQLSPSAKKAALIDEHVKGWAALWELMTIEMSTNRSDIARAVNSTLYGMLSLHDETDTVPFPASPLDGITLGSFGHWGGCYLWDADMWMYPVIALWRPDFMSKMLQYRVDRLPGARANAKLYGNDGVMIPVMTCGSGAEATSSQGNITDLGVHELHQSADTVFEAQQHWRLTGAKDLDWVHKVGLPLASGVADFYASRASVRHDGSGSDQLHFEAACGPDEHNVFVNDSAYLIGAAITAIDFAVELAHVAAVTDQYNVSKWQDTIRRLSPSLPFDSARQFHPEFEGMDKSYDHFQAKQADTLMLQYPLMFNHSTMTPQAKLNDLLYYSKHSLISPDMTQAIYSIVALELNQTSLASSLFDLAYKRFNFPPYYTWSEKADGSGNVPYLTSGGGWLQSLTYGYVGIRVLADQLRLRPQLPVGVERMALRRLQYCGERIDVEYNATVATVKLSAKMTTAPTSLAAKGTTSRLRIRDGSGGWGALPAVFPTGAVAFVSCGGSVAEVKAVALPMCNTLEDCNRAGDCTAVHGNQKTCICDPGWKGDYCQYLDLEPQPSPEAGAAWNTRSSPNSSWCVHPFAASASISASAFAGAGAGANASSDGGGGDHSKAARKYHLFVSEMPPGCGLSTWLPGSRIIHVEGDSPTGPFTFKDRVYSSFHHNPHLAVASDGTFLLYFNGRNWPEDDINSTCKQNSSSPPGEDWHGGGLCSKDADCTTSAILSARSQHQNTQCLNGRCKCEKHSFGGHCEKKTETVNLAYAKSLSGPWQQLLPDGTAFFADGNASLGLSNPSAWTLSNGTVVLAYSRAPDLGIAVAPHWRGPYTRLSLPTPSGSRNYSLVSPSGGEYGSHGAEDPFLYRDARGTWRMVFHGYGGDNMISDGQSAYSTDLLHWTWQPEPVYSSTIEYADGSPPEVFPRRERPALLLDASGFPTHLFNGVKPPNASYKGKCFSYVQATAHGAELERQRRGDEGGGE